MRLRCRGVFGRFTADYAITLTKEEALRFAQKVIDLATEEKKQRLVEVFAGNRETPEFSYYEDKPSAGFTQQEEEEFRETLRKAIQMTHKSLS